MRNYEYLRELQNRTTPSLFTQIVSPFFESSLKMSEPKTHEFSPAMYQERDVFCFDQWAQRILLLVKHCCRKVINNIAKKMTGLERASYTLLKNEHDRLLWAWGKRREVFDVAYRSIPKRLTGDHRSRLACSMYRLPAGFTLKNAAKDCVRVREKYDELFWFSDGEVAYDYHLHTAKSSFCDSPIHDTAIYFNRTLRGEPVVIDKKLVYEEREKADSVYIVFHQESGIIEIYAPAQVDRDQVAGLFAVYRLNIKEPLTKIVFAFSHLCQEQTFSSSNPEISSVKVTSFNFRDKKSSSRYEMKSSNRGKIHDDLVFKNKANDRVLTQASISVEILRKNQPVQSLHIQFISHDDVRMIAANAAVRWGVFELLQELDLIEDAEANELHRTE